MERQMEICYLNTMQIKLVFHNLINQLAAFRSNLWRQFTIIYKLGLSFFRVILNSFLFN